MTPLKELVISKPWDKLKGETDRAYKAFTSYRDMKESGAINRDLQTLANTLLIDGKKRTKNSLAQWCAKFHWLERCRIWDKMQQTENIEFEQIKRHEVLSKFAIKDLHIGMLGQEYTIAILSHLSGQEIPDVIRAKLTDETLEHLEEMRTLRIDEIDVKMFRTIFLAYTHVRSVFLDWVTPEAIGDTVSNSLKDSTEYTEDDHVLEQLVELEHEIEGKI